MPLYNLATRRLEDTYPYVTQVTKSSVSPDKWSFADGLGNPVYWFDGTASYAMNAGTASFALSSSGGTAATASHSLTTKAAGIEWDIQLNSASAVDGILGVAELGRGYYNWNYGAWTFGNRITGSYANLIGSWSFHTNKDNYAIGEYSIAHGYKNIAADSADSVEGYFTSTANDTVTSLNLNFTYDSVSNILTVLQPGDFTTELNDLDLTNANLNAWFYNATDDILYPVILPNIATYNAGSNRTEILTPGSIGNTDSTGNGVLYYQSFSSALKGEPLANHAEGDHTVAAGDASHAEGKYTWASAVGSHAEGLNTISSNSGSHAEGRNTQAKGDGSHAEGSDTIASGSSAHAEGYATLAQGEFSHAEGFYTIASGSATHAGGRETNAIGYGSRAIGYQTNAVGEYSNAEGHIMKSVGNYSHAEGYSGSAFGIYSHVEGNATETYGSASHAEGSSTKTYILGYNSPDAGITTPGTIYLDTAYGDVTSNFIYSNYIIFYDTGLPFGSYGSVIFKYTSVTYDSLLGQTVIVLEDSSVSGNQAYIAPLGNSNPVGVNMIMSADYSHTEGQSTATVGIGSHAEGNLTRAVGNYSHAEGSNTIANSNAHAEGNSTVATGDGSHAEGSYTRTIGQGSHAEGRYTIANGDYSHTEGSASYAGGEGAHAEGIGTYINDTTDYAHAEGGYTYVRGDYSHAEGYYTSASFSVKAPVAAHAEGYGSKALNKGAHAEGYYTIANGQYGHTEGWGTVTGISTNAAHAEGFYTVASGTYSHAEGSGSISYGTASHAEGIFTVASGSGQLAVGRYNILDNTDDYFVIGDGTSGGRSNAFGVNDQRMYASNSIFFPDLTDVFKPHILVFDTGSKQVFYYTGSGLGGGGGGPANIIVYSSSVLLTSTVSSFNFTGTGVNTTAAGNDVTVDIPGVNIQEGGTTEVTAVRNINFTGGGVSVTPVGSNDVTIDITGIGPGTINYLAYFNATNNVVSNTIRYDSSVNRYYVEGKSVDICDPNYNGGTSPQPNILFGDAVSLPDQDGSNLYVNNIAPCSEQQVIYGSSQQYNTAGGNIGNGYNRGPYNVVLKHIDLTTTFACYGIKVDYSLIILDPDLFGTQSFDPTGNGVGVYDQSTLGIGVPWAPPTYTETGTIMVTFTGQSTNNKYFTLNTPMGSQLPGWQQTSTTNVLNISENYTFTIDPTWPFFASIPTPHDNNRGFQFAYKVENNLALGGSDCYFEWVLSNDIKSADIYISYVTTILKYQPYI